MGRLTTGQGDAQWYALRVHPQKEYTAAYLLRKAGVRTFVPTETHFRRRTRYSKNKAEYAHPVIPGCVFAGFDGDPLWYNVMRNTLIIGPEGMDGHPWQLKIEGKGGLFEFLGRSIDGCMVLEGGVKLVDVQGRGVLRAPTTQVRTIAKRGREPVPVVEVKGQRARLLARFVIPEKAALKAAA